MLLLPAFAVAAGILTILSPSTPATARPQSRTESNR